MTSRASIWLVAGLAVLSWSCGASSSDGAGVDRRQATTTTEGTAEDPGAGSSGTVPGDGDESPPPSPSGGSSADQFEEALAAAFADPYEGMGMSGDQARCLAPRWVEILDVDRLNGSGMTPERLAAGLADLSGLRLDEAEAEALYDTYGVCDVDVKGILLETLAGGSSDEELIECLDARLEDDLLARIMIASMVDDEEALEPDSALGGEVVAVLQTCEGPAG